MVPFDTVIPSLTIYSAQGPVLTPEGLTDFGKDVVLEMNRLGMMVDISHVSPSAMRTVLSISKGSRSVFGGNKKSANYFFAFLCVCIVSSGKECTR